MVESNGPKDDGFFSRFHDVPPSPGVAARWKQQIPFDWHDLPCVELGISEVHPADQREKWTIQLKSGREIELNSLIQDVLYSGYLEGIPGNPNVELSESFTAAKKKFPQVDADPYILPPVMKSGAMRWVEDDGKEVLNPWKLLPPIRSIGFFSSNLPAKDQSQDGSWMVVIWYQDQFGNITDSEIKSKLAGIDWDELSAGWSY